MKFKLRTEISEEYENEVILRASMPDEDLFALQKTLSQLLSGNAEISLLSDGKEYFLPLDDLLFFETDGSKTVAHTKDRVFYTDKRLWELEQSLPYSFLRVSKSCILNVKKISSIAKNITGASTVTFFSSQKIAYVSRSFYKLLRERIENVRLRTGQ